MFAESRVWKGTETRQSKRAELSPDWACGMRRKSLPFVTSQMMISRPVYFGKDFLQSRIQQSKKDIPFLRHSPTRQTHIIVRKHWLVSLTYC